MNKPKRYKRLIFEFWNLEKVQCERMFGERSLGRGGGASIFYNIKEYENIRKKT